MYNAFRVTPDIDSARGGTGSAALRGSVSALGGADVVDKALGRKSSNNKNNKKNNKKGGGGEEGEEGEGPPDATSPNKDRKVSRDQALLRALARPASVEDYGAFSDGVVALMRGDQWPPSPAPAVDINQVRRCRLTSG